MKRTPGKIIAAFGIPGSGKSTTIKKLAAILRAESFHEPEAKRWPEAVNNRTLSGNFTAITWFRSIRVPFLYKADELRKCGKIALLDSYYDKLFHLYMEKDGIQWLFKKNDPYYEEMKGIAEKDYKMLPDADILIFFRIDHKTWHAFLKSRKRQLDADKTFLEHCFKSQDHFLDAAEEYCDSHNCKLIIFDQEFSSPRKTAKKVARLLLKEHLRELHD